MMEMIRDDLAALNVTHEVFFSERSLIHGEGSGRRDHRVAARARAMFTKAACRRRRALPLKIGRTANKRSFVRPPSATMSIVR